MDDVEAFETFKDLEKYIGVEDSLDFLMLALQERPAALITVFHGNLSKDFREHLQDLTEYFGLEYLVHKERESVFDALIYLARDEDRLERFEPGEASKKEIGLFLDYPENAVEAFTSESSTRDTFRKFGEMMSSEEKTEDEAIEFLENSGASYLERFEAFTEKLMAEEKLDREEKSYLRLVPYTPALEEASVVKAVERGREREKVLERLDEENDFDIGSYFLKSIRHSA